MVRQLGVIVFFLVACASVSAYLGFITSEQDEEYDALPHVLVSGLDFGEIWVDKHFQGTFQVENRGSRSAVVDRFTISCGCISFNPDAITLQPGEKRDVIMTVDLTMLPKGEMKEAQDYAIAITPLVTPSREAPQPWVVRARVKYHFTVSPSSVGFEFPLIKGEPPTIKKVKLRAATPIENLTLRSDDKDVTATLTRVDGDSNAYWIEVVIADSHPVGIVRCRITAEAFCIEQQRGVSRSFEVTGLVLPNIQALPASIFLGSRMIGEEVSGSVRITSLTGRPFVVEGIDAPQGSEGFSVSLGSNRNDFKTNCKVRKEGLCTSIVRFKVKDESGAVVSVPFEMSYYGIGR